MSGRAPGRWRSAGILVAVAAGALVVTAGARAAADGRGPTPKAASVQVDPSGEAGFARQCAGCHGAAGAGAVGPDLRLWTGTVDELAGVIVAGADGMPAFSPTLPAAQIDAIAAYVDGLVGASVYATECASCHGTDGGGSLGPSLKTSQADEAARRSAIESGIGSMPAFGDVLDADQLDALVWRTAGYQDVGPDLFAGHCAACHGPAGGGGTGPSLVASTIEAPEAISIVRSGFGGMPAFGSTLAESDIEAVVAFALRLEPTSSTTTTTTAATTTTVAASPPELYSAWCASCHGEDAEGAIGPGLTDVELGEDDIRRVIVDGQGSMPGLSGALTSEQVSALVGFVQVLASPESAGEATVAGADLYAHQCAACHGADGRGALGPSLRTTGLAGTELRAAIVQGTDTMPAFGLTLDTGQIEVLVDFVEWLKGTDQSIVVLRGGPAIYRQDCAGCHGQQGEGAVGPELRGMDLTVNEIVARVYGGHEAGMPAFAGALDGQQVREVAQFVRGFEPGPGSDGGMNAFEVFALAVAGLAVLAGGVIAARRIAARRR